MLLFKPLVADSRDEVLEMGIADTLITRLNNLKQITVRPINAVRRYTALDQDTGAAGRELDVQAVVEGNIQVMPLARDAAVQALKLDERLAEAHASRGRIFLDYDWDWAQAEKEFQTALEAIAVLQKTLDMEPNFLAARMYIGFCYLMEGKRDEAMAEFQKAHVASPNSPDAMALLGYTCALAGQREQARSYEKALDELARRQIYVSPISYALIATGMGDMDAAFKWMEKGYEERSPSMRGLKTDPLNDPLRTDPRFASLLRRVGFEQ